jgi:hypothetical protein
VLTAVLGAFALMLLLSGLVGRGRRASSWTGAIAAAATEKRSRQPSSNTSSDAKAAVREMMVRTTIAQKASWYAANAAAPAATAPVQLEMRRPRPTRPDSSSISANAPSTAVSTRSVPTSYLFSA